MQKKTKKHAMNAKENMYEVRLQIHPKTILTCTNKASKAREKDAQCA